jgi:aryl-alcohol dehydrogenase-like predicted oxidoreductase
MQTRYLGKTGVSVSNLCLGAMMFGEWGTKDHDESIRIIHRALDAGINFIDTADIYSAGESEEIVGKALAGGRRENVVLASKAHMPMGDDPNQRGNSRRWIVTEVENSLRRLQTDWIDLYQIHRPDPNTDIDETLGALTDLVHQGKIRYFGHSTFPVSEIIEAQWTAERRGRERFRCEQPPYSILTRAVEHDVLPTCQRYGMGVIPYSSPAAGYQAVAARTPTFRGRCPPRANASPIGLTCRCKRTSASSTPPTRSPSSPTTPGSRWSRWRSRSSSATPRSPPRSSAPHHGAPRIPAHRRRRHADR